LSNAILAANVYIQKGEGIGLDAWLELDESNQLSLAVMDCVKKNGKYTTQLGLYVRQEKPLAELEELVGKYDQKMDLVLCINRICEEREWKFLESGFGNMFFTEFPISQRHEPIHAIRVVIPNESMKYEYRGNIDKILKRVCR
jgi:hypothetical protein